MGTPGSKADLAAKRGLHRTWPNAVETENVGTSNTTIDLTSFGSGEVDLRGRWVFFFSRVGATTGRRFSGSAPTLTAGVGPTIAQGAYEELFVDPDGATELRVIGDNAAGKLDAWYDDEQ